MQKSTTEVVKMASDFITPNIAKVAIQTAVIDFIVNDANLQIFRIITNCHNKYADLKYRKYYCEN